MAFTSFTVRNTISDSGSALRRTNVTQDSTTPNGSGAAIYDSGLRADGFFTPVPESYLESTFEINVYRRDEVELEWTIATPLVTTPAGMGFEPVELLIRASSTGEPVTANDGILVKAYTYSDYAESLTDTNRPYIVDGGWIYYSLFLKYADSTGDAFYEKVADLSIQIPINFQSTDALWKRIPTYYRELDYDYATKTPDYDHENGPLYRFIELFGWEMDKFRTTIYDTMRINDPDVVHSSAIDALATQTGVEFGKYALGTTKLRNILNNIGYLRRSKGTQDSVEAYISALTGCGVSTRLTGGVINFDVHPMRVNLFTDPFFNQGVTSPVTADSGATQRKWTELNESVRTYGWGVYASFSSTPASPISVVTTGDKLTVTLPALSGTVTLLVYSRGKFAYNNNLTYYYSAISSHNFTPRFMQASFVDTTMEGTTPPSSLTYADNWNNSVTTFPTHKDVLTNDTRKIIASIPNTSTPPAIDVFPVYKFDITLSATSPTVVTFQDPLVEYRNSSGEFFTGSTAMGGFIPNASIEGDPSAGLYDYHWGSNASSTKDRDFSFYTLDFQRSKSVAIDVVSNYIMPVTLVKGVNYEINWEVLE
jgi:hypothetical protein